MIIFAPNNRVLIHYVQHVLILIRTRYFWQEMYIFHTQNLKECRQHKNDEMAMSLVVYYNTCVIIIN